MVDHPSAPCRQCGAPVYATASRCPHCGADLPPDHPTPPGWTRDERGRIVYRFGATVRIERRDGKTTAAIRETEDGEPTGHTHLIQHLDEPSAPGGPAPE